MIKQYLLFAVVLLIAVFILTEVEWGNFVERADQSGTPKISSEQTGVGGGVSRSDLSTGRSDSIINQANWQTASSSPIRAATSTRLRSGQISDNPFSLKDDEQDLSQLPQASTNDNQTNPASGVKVSTSGEQNIALPQDAKQTRSKQNELPLEPSTSQANEPGETTEQSSEEEALSELQTNIQIRGHVLDSQGNLIMGIPLSLELLHASVEDSARFGKRKLNTRSNEKGVYTFLNLVEGDYRVCTVNAKGYRQVCQKPRAPHLSADISLTPIHNGNISGVVKDAQGRALKAVTVLATPGQKNRVVTDENGEYSLPMAVNKDISYQIYFSKQNDYRRERITVNGAEILASKILDVTLSELSGFDVSGVVRDQHSNTVKGLTVTLSAPSLKSNNSLYGVTKQNGEFLIHHVEPAKDYRLTMSKRGYTFDRTAYQKMELSSGMAPLQIDVQKKGVGHFSARVATPEEVPLAGELFILHSDNGHGGQSTSDSDGRIEFSDAPATVEGSSLRISNNASPKYVFSGMTLREGEYKSDIKLVVDRGVNSLTVKVVDAQTSNVVQGAQGILTWTHKSNGVTSQTTRLKGKKSLENTGEITFTELSLGAHQLRITMPGYHPYAATIDINQALQQHEVKLVKK